MVRWSWQQAGVGVAVAWVLLTLGHFLTGGAATATHPTPVPVGKEQVQEQVVEREEEEGQEEEGNYEAWWREQVERRVRVAETCAREGISQKAERATFLYDPEHRLLFCRNAKVATTTWLAHFLSLAELPGDEEEQIRTRLHKKVPKMFPVQGDDPSIPLLAQATISFSMVRHPFERLVSAYQDKVVKGADPHYTWVGELLRRRYGGASFPAFVRMVLAQGTKDCPRPGHGRCAVDKHWKPFVSRCAFCTTHYTVIAKAETFKEDLRFISKLANVTFVEEVKKNHSFAKKSTSELTADYFKQVGVAEVAALYQQYRVDFAMFGYTPDYYLQLARG